MPSIAEFLQLPLRKEVAREVDGIPFTGPVAIGAPSVKKEDNKLMITWKAFQKKGKAKIWVTTTNHFKTGAEDQYTLITTVPVKKEKAMVDVSKLPGDLYKVVIESTANMVNRWVVIKQ
jgi:hypothetical protein